LFAHGQTLEALALYHAAMMAYPLDLESRLRVADCVAALSSVERAAGAYRSVAWFALKSGHPLTALVAARVLVANGVAADDIESGFAALYGKDAETGGVGAARLSTPSVDSPLSAPIGDTGDLLARAARDAETCMSDFDEFPEALHSVNLFSRLSAETLRRVLGTLVVKRLPVGEQVMRQGEKGDTFFFVTQGEVCVYTEDPDGTRRDLAFLGEGAVFGEMALLRREPRSASVEVTRDADLLELTRASLQTLAQELEPLAEALTAFMQSRLLANLLARNPLFRPFNEGQRHQLLRRFTSHEVVAGTEIIRKGELGTGLFLVLDGEVSVHTEGEAGEAVATLGPGAVFGEMALVRDAPTSATVVATTPTTVLFLAGENVRSMIAGVPEIRQYLEDLAEDRALDNELSASAEAGGKDVIILF